MKKRADTISALGRKSCLGGHRGSAPGGGWWAGGRPVGGPQADVRGGECGAAWKPPSLQALGSVASRVRGWRCSAWEGSSADDVKVRQAFFGEHSRPAGYVLFLVEGRDQEVHEAQTSPSQKTSRCTPHGGFKHAHIPALPFRGCVAIQLFLPQFPPLESG